MMAVTPPRMMLPLSAACGDAPNNNIISPDSAIITIMIAALIASWSVSIPAAVATS